jgi:hypothetical protein
MSDQASKPATDAARRAILARIAAQVSDSHDLGYTDSPFYNDHAGSGFFPEYSTSTSESQEFDKKE